MHGGLMVIRDVTDKRMSEQLKADFFANAAEERVTYEISDESGQAHNKQFTANVLLNGQIIGTGKGKSKKEAEQSAAKEAISLMGYETN